jgi:hypothetical protein
MRLVTSAVGTSRRFAATQDVFRFRSEADMSRLVRQSCSRQRYAKVSS